MATYTKLRSGEWGVRVQGDVREGQAVTVARRDGTLRTERIARVVWRGTGVALCAVSRSGGSGTRGRGRERQSGKICWETGLYCYSSDGSPYCDECGEHMYH